MSSPSEVVTVTPALLRAWGLPEPGASKNSRGRLVVVGGSATSPGAVVLAGEAALRVGAGKVGIATAADAAVAVRTSFLEAGIHEIGADGTLAGSGVDALAAADAVLVGPGLDGPVVAHTRLGLLRGDTSACAVLDAFAIGILPDVDRADLPETLILNMNLDEAAVLLGRDVDEPLADAAALAARFDAVVHCYEAVATPDGRVWRVAAGGAGLGTAGSGDVLAGAIAGFAARGMSPERAAVWGAWSHGRSGDRLTARTGHGFLARELAAELPHSVREVVPESASDAEDGDG